jgi:hypothetical protein
MVFIIIMVIVLICFVVIGLRDDSDNDGYF